MFKILQAMSPQQYLFAFGFLCSYALALGKFLDPMGRLVAIVAALMTAVAFCTLSESWTDAVMLVAVTLVVMGMFTGGVWVLWAVMALSQRPTAESEATAATTKASTSNPLALLHQLRARLRLI